MLRGTSFVLALALAFAVVQSASALDREVLRSHCRLMTLYVSGPGTLQDYLNRWSFYMAPYGTFTVPGRNGEVVHTPADWMEKTKLDWDQYATFNHVNHPEEADIQGSTCVLNVYHALLAWDGRCGPLIFKEKLTIKTVPDAQTADEAKIVEWEAFTDHEAILAQIESCAPPKEVEP